jgi:hypothetical protein
MGSDWDDKTPPERAAPVQRYEVSFTYVEPEYARERGIAELPYVGSFEVVATDPDEAVVLAERVFREAATRSGVSWPREIRSVSWRRL